MEELMLLQPDETMVDEINAYRNFFTVFIHRFFKELRVLNCGSSENDPHNT